MALEAVPVSLNEGGVATTLHVERRTPDSVESLVEHASKNEVHGTMQMQGVGRKRLQLTEQWRMC